MSDNKKKWAGDTFGTPFMHKCLIAALRHTDVRVFYVFSAVFIVPWCLVFSAGSRIIYRYLRGVHGFSVWRSLWLTLVNYVLFSQVVIDKFALFAGRRMHISIEGYDNFLSLSARAGGFVMLSAHIGCYEMAGYELCSQDKPFNALVYAGEKEAVMKGRDKLFTENNIKMIPVRDDMSHLFGINSALQRGEIVSIPADRVFGSPKVVTVQLLGRSVHLPAGPFSVPAMRGDSVLAVNVMKTGVREYTAYVTPLDYDRKAPRRQQIQQIADGYARELGRMLKRYPAQWYNYFDFWK